MINLRAQRGVVVLDDLSRSLENVLGGTEVRRSRGWSFPDGGRGQQATDSGWPLEGGKARNPLEGRHPCPALTLVLLCP